MFPEGYRTNDKEFVMLKDLVDSDLRLRAYTDLVRDEVSKGTRDAERWVHPASDVDARLAV